MLLDRAAFVRASSFEIDASFIEVLGGSILAPGGTIQLNATDKVYVDGKLNASGETGGSIRIQGDIVSILKPVLADGNLQGGNISIEARNLLQASLISADSLSGQAGTIDVQFTHRYIDLERSISSASTSLGTRGGTIHIDGGASGRLFTSGTHRATGLGDHSTGGRVVLLGQEVLLTAAQVEASGTTQGGEVLVGGGLRGEGNFTQARRTLVTASASISSDSLEQGQGGQVVLWSRESTEFMGSISVSGSQREQGGFVEVSSKGKVSASGSIDAKNLTLDPKNIIIDDSAGVFAEMQLVDPNPVFGEFYRFIGELSNGNLIVSDSLDSFGGDKAGAVYLFNGLTGALISTLIGSSANDQIDIRDEHFLPNGNYVASSQYWDNGAIVDAGAATFCSGATGCSGSVTTSNSLYGTQFQDFVSVGGINVISNNYIVISSEWNNGAIADAGAVTFCSGTTGCIGPVTTGNSLHGTTADDHVSEVTVLSGGKYIVSSTNWNDGATEDVGAVTLCPATGCTGAVTKSNSLHGTTSNDRVGLKVISLSNGNYVVQSPDWDNGGVTDAGAVTFCSGTTGCTGAVSTSNSLYGTTASDKVGRGKPSFAELSNGKYVVSSIDWNNGAATQAGAITFCSGTTGCTGAVSASNSLVGSTTDDQIGLGWGNASSYITALTNGNYVVSSPLWDNGAATDAGAATFCSGTTGCTGVINSANSLLGTVTNDQIAEDSTTALTNGNYVVVSPSWLNGSTFGLGAVTFGNGTTGVTGNVTTSNSLYGTNEGDSIGSNKVTALPNGNYVVNSPNWDHGRIINAGAVTFCDGTSGCIGAVTVSNSLHGSSTLDQVGEKNIVVLTNGNYVVNSYKWDNGALVDAGAATFCSGSTGCAGPVSTSNSLVGSASGEKLISSGVKDLSDGRYAVQSESLESIRKLTFCPDTGCLGSITTRNTFSPTGLVNGFALYENSVHETIGANVSYLSGSGGGEIFLIYFDPNQSTYERFAGNSISIHPDFLSETLNKGTAVVLQASNDLTVSSEITVNNPSGSGGALTLQAGRSLLINANITTDDGGLSLIANDLLANGVVDADRDAGEASILMGFATRIEAGSGSVLVELRDGAGKTHSDCGRIALETINSAGFTRNNFCPANLVVDPASGQVAAGPQGGPFTPNKIMYKISNYGGSPTNYTVTIDQSWTDLVDGGGGTLAPETSATIEVTFNASANALANGIHESLLTFTNTTNGSGNGTRKVSLGVGTFNSSRVGLSGDNILFACGGGNCSGGSRTFTVSNNDSAPINYFILTSQTFLDISPASGSLPAGQSIDLTATINANAANADSSLGTNVAFIFVFDADTGEFLATKSFTLDLDIPMTMDAANSVLSTYWQFFEPTYVFVAVSHPSLSGMSPEIGVRASAFKGDGVSLFSTSEEFTVSAGETHRLFILGSPQGDVFFQTLAEQGNNPNTSLIMGTSNGGSGFLRFDPVASDPTFPHNGGLPDVTMLSYWGAIVFSDANTGFAMEFIGDLDDSSAHPNQDPAKFPSGVR